MTPETPQEPQHFGMVAETIYIKAVMGEEPKEPETEQESDDGRRQ